MSCLRKQATGDVSVEVNACPGPDLRKILEDLRCQYETLMERNRKETEQWYACKVLYTCPALPYSAYRGEKREIKSPPLSGDVWVAAILPGVCSALNYTANYSALLLTAEEALHGGSQRRKGDLEMLGLLQREQKQRGQSPPAR